MTVARAMAAVLPLLLFGSLALAQGGPQCASCHGGLEHSLAHLASFEQQNKDQQQKEQSQPKSDNDNCIACHGDSAQHAQRPKKFTPTIVFGPQSDSSASKQSEQCLGCHQASQAHWQASTHEHAGLGCVSCHTNHQSRDPVLQRENQVENCTSCHLRVRSELHLPSRHPIAEGKTICTDCHSPHSSMSDSQLVEPDVNQTCFNCHAEKRGPFLFEHAAASDNCSNCHTPHGSVNPALLNARTPFLCQQCHSAAFHPSVAPSGSGLPSGLPSASLLGKDCMNCHNQVHGSNHPSGPSLMR